MKIKFSMETADNKNNNQEDQGVPSKKNEDKKTAVIPVIILFCVMILTVLAYQYRDDLNFRERWAGFKNSIFSSHQTGVKFDIMTDIDDQRVGVKFYIPCKSMREKQKLEKKITLIRHELLMSMSVQENIQFMKSRDFAKIKSLCLSIINRFSPAPVKKVYLEFFMLD